MSTRDRRTYDHRLRELVWRTQDTSSVARLSIPRSTLDDWLRCPPTPVVTLDELDREAGELRAEVLRLRQRIAKLLALLRLLVALVKSVGASLECQRLPEGKDKARVLRAVDHSRQSLPIRVALRAVGLSASRFGAWCHSRAACELEDPGSCPKLSPQRLTIGEIRVIREMACAEEFRHVSTGTLAMLAQRMGRAFASAQTWYRLIHRNGWRRPRKKVHPSRPRRGIRAAGPNELWHVDSTIIRLLDGTKVYPHAIIDNFSRRILAWRISDHFEVASTAILPGEAAASNIGAGEPPKLFTDGGVESFNGSVDALIASGLIKRVLAQTDVTFSNSMIEAWWRVLKHNWLFLNKLDSIATVRRLAAFYIEQHNSVMPHAAFSGQTPDEMYFWTGAEVSAKLEAGREEARKRRRSRIALWAAALVRRRRRQRERRRGRPSRGDR